ncbi:MAG: hypothetical protein K5867_09460 [Bacteroidales bacterium]|nr:hypothetical protein [Bacteroidales bacterium]
MKHRDLEFPQNARRTYTAVKHAFETCGAFHRVKCDDSTFVITARHGMSLLALGEKIKVRVVATSTQSSKVVVESGNQIPINLLNIGSNKRNVSNLSDWIANQVYRLCSNEELHIKPPEIKLRQNDIRLRGDK